MSEQIDEIAAALVEASKTLRNPERNRTVNVKTKNGDRYSYSYTTLDAVLDEVRPKLAAAGIAILQPLVWHDGKPFVSTRLLHSSGQWIEHEVPVVVEDGRMSETQAFGSAMTYARRYGLESLLPIAAEYDDDGVEAGGDSREQAPTCPKCGKSDKVIRSKRGSGWWCLKPCSTAFGDDSIPEAREPGEDDAPEKTVASDGTCPDCGSAGRKTEYTKEGMLFCGKCRKVFGVSK